MFEGIVENLPMILCLVFGMGLLVAEMFLPGFGVCGVSGILLNIIAIWQTWNKYGPFAALGMFIVVVAITSIILSIMMRSAAKGKLAKSPIVLNETSGDEPQMEPGLSELVGKNGVALTMLRPAGAAEIGGMRLDVVTDGVFIEKGEAIVIERIEGNKIVVKTL